MAMLKDSLITGDLRVTGTIYGNATSADKLSTARTINGTSFNGTANITTANWGTARNVYIADNDGTNTGPAVSVNGGSNPTLKLPATIKASLTGNASTAAKLQNARTIAISGGATGTATSFDGSGNITIPVTGLDMSKANAGTLPVGRGGTGATTFTANRVLLGNGANAIKVGNVNYTEAAGTKGGTKYMFRVWGTTVGNTATELVSQTAGVMRFGDAGPQIQFSSAETGGQQGALIFTDHDSSGSGVSWHFVSSEGDNNNGGNATVTAPRFRARANLTVGQNTDNTSYNLYVNGTGYFTGNVTGAKVYGAVWNDFAEYRQGENLPGKVMVENGDDSVSISTKRLQPGASICSDTYGFAIGETDECKCPIAVAGRVLAYPLEPREEYNFFIGQAVCSGPNGTVSIMTKDEVKEYPEAVVGYISAVPKYETWGTGNIKVNGRVWIKVK